MQFIARIIFFALLPIVAILLLVLNIVMFITFIFIKILRPLQKIGKTCIEFPRWATWWEN